MAAFEIIALDPVTPQLRAPGSADTYLASRAFDIRPGTLTTAIPVLDMGATWNNAAVTFAGMRFNVTDTASNAASLLMDFQVGGASRFQVTKLGALNFLSSGGSGTPNIVGASTLVLGVNNGSVAITGQFGNWTAIFRHSDALVLYNNTKLGFSSSNAAEDVFIARDAADTLAQRNSTNAQTFRIYGTFTDASNHRRVQLGMTAAGVATLRAEGAGTGASGNVLHISSLPTANPGPGILWNNAGTPAIGT